MSLSPLPPTISNQVKLVFVLALVGSGLLGSFLLYRSTPYGLGLVNDTASYVGGAANLLAGNGYTRTSGGGELKPITHFPPLFSLILAGAGLVSLDIFRSAHILILALFALDIILVGSLVYTASKSVAAALFAALLLTFSDTTLGVYALLLSEPLFITLMLASFLCFAMFFNQQHASWLFVAGVLLGLAYLTRFAAISLLATLIIAVLLLGKPIRQAFRQVIVLLAGMLPFALGWLLYNLSTSGEMGNRQLIFHPLSFTKLFEAMKNLLTWLAPDDLLAVSPIFGRALSALSLLVLPLLFISLVVFLWSQHRQELLLRPDNTLTFVLALHVLVYLAFLVASLSFFDASTPLDDRILLVVYIPELILFAAGLAWLSRRLAPAPGWQRIALWTVCLALVGFSIRDGFSSIEQLSRDGLGFNHSGWRNSQAIQAVRNMPGYILYSNRSTAIYLLTGRSSYVTPSPVDVVTTQARSNYQSDLEEMRSRILAGQAALVLFGMKNNPEDSALYAALTQGLPLQADYGDDQIFMAQP